MGELVKNKYVNICIKCALKCLFNLGNFCTDCVTLVQGE